MSLQELIDENEKAANPVEDLRQEAVKETTEATGSVEVAPEPTAVGDASQRDDANATPSVAHRFLEQLGYDVEGASEEQLVEEVRRRLAATPEPGPKAVEQEKPQSVATPNAVKADDTVAQIESKRIASIALDDGLTELIEYNESGIAVPREGAGPEGDEAAKKVNSYMKEYKARLKRLGEDPLAFLESSGLDEIIESRVNKKLEAYEAMQAEAARRAAIEQMAQGEQEQARKFFDEHRAEIYALGKDGKPKLIGDVTALTPFGKALKDEFDELQRLAPGAPTHELLGKAYGIVKRVSAAPQAAPEPVNKKKKFLEAAAAPEPSRGSVTSPSPSELVGSGASLRDLILADPANEGDPSVVKLRAGI